MWSGNTNVGMGTGFEIFIFGSGIYLHMVFHILTTNIIVSTSETTEASTTKFINLFSCISTISKNLSNCFSSCSDKICQLLYYIWRFKIIIQRKTISYSIADGSLYTFASSSVIMLYIPKKVLYFL